MQYEVVSTYEWEKFYRKLQGRTLNLKRFLWRKVVTSQHASLISLKEVK